MDRQLNAGLNIARAVRRETAELRGLWPDPGALSEEAGNPLYPRTTVRGHGKSGGRRRRIDSGRRLRNMPE
jgi:hypothetical protein